MDPTDIPLFRLADQRLAWLDRRQALLAQNVANVDTPAYCARDLQPFGAALQGALNPTRTDAAHLAGDPALLAAAGRAVGGERAPDGNAVSLDAQLAQVADTETAQQLTSQLYSKYLGLFRTAIGR